jgi:hypothetical protein
VTSTKRVRNQPFAPTYASHLAPPDLDIVAQTADLADGRGFDLVVATKVVVYYDRFQQGLATSNIVGLMNPSGIFLCNTYRANIWALARVLPAQHGPQFAYLGRRTVIYSEARSYGDDVMVCQKRSARTSSRSASHRAWGAR